MKFTQKIHNKPYLELLSGGLLIILIFTAYIPAIGGGFVWDDDLHITENILLRTNDGLRKIWFEPGSWPHYYPLVLTSFWIQYQLWGLNPAGYHVTNIVLHALNVLLLWRILRRLNIPGSYLAACIFALHPVHVESVAWATENKNVLSGFFYLSSLLVYLFFLFSNNDKYSSNPNHNDGSGLFGTMKERLLYLIALILFLCALFAKTVTCSLPAVILLLIWWKNDCITWKDILYTVPFFIFGLILGLGTIWTELYNVGSTGGVAWELTIIERILISGRAYWFYIGKLLWPVNLSFIYPRWDINTNIWWQYFFPAGCLIVLSALYLLKEKIGKGALVAVLIFGGTLIPAVGFINLFTMRYSYVADHFQYLASISLIALFSTGINVFFSGRYGQSRYAKIFQPIIYFSVIILFGTAVWNESGKFKNPEALWRDTIKKSNEAALAHLNLANIVNGRGSYQEAEKHAAMAIQINPDLYEAHNTLGNALFKQGRGEEAIKHFADAIQIAESEKVGTVGLFYFNMGEALVKIGRLNEGIQYFQKALKVKPDYVDAHRNLGNALLLNGQYEEAIMHFAEVIRLRPKQHYSYANMGVALAMVGRVDEGIYYIRKALQIKPDYEVARQNLEKVLKMRTGQ